MAYSCPLNFQRVDATHAKVVTSFVAVTLLLYLYFGYTPLLYLLVYDFTMRLLCDRNLSPFYLGAAGIQKLFSMQKRMSDGGAKRLAGYFGLLFSLLLVVGDMWHAQLFTQSVGFLFVVCSLADLIFDFCLGCKIYYIIKKIYPSFMENSL